MKNETERDVYLRVWTDVSYFTHIKLALNFFEL